MLVAGARAGAGREAAVAAALLAEGGLRPPGGDHGDSDVALAVAQASLDPRRKRVVTQLERAIRHESRPAVGPVSEALGRSVLAGWPDRVALRRGPDTPRARLVGGRGVRLDDRSAVRTARLFVAVDVDDAMPEGRVRVASAVQESWLEVEEADVLAFDDAAEAVRARRVRRYGDLELASQPIEADPIEASNALLAAAATRLDRALPEAPAFATLCARLGFAHHLAPRDWPAPDEAFLASLLPALVGGRRSLAELRAAPWADAVRDTIGWNRWQELGRLAPERWTAPSGRSFRVQWSRNQPPVLPVPMQHLFGLQATPCVGDGRVPLLLHLLAPNGRPQQITDDLDGFWTRTWPEVRRELRARYPKHAWPEDPRTAEPGGPRRRR